MLISTGTVLIKHRIYVDEHISHTDVFLPHRCMSLKMA